jgi:ribosomal protein S18 acetylase RimI-like enzyme
MGEDAHLERYLRFMRSPVYDPERDLVAVAPDGRIAAFMIWWPDRSGIAQIEPFGTHPDFQRRGVGKALIDYGRARMAEAGMHTIRVCTETTRTAAASFYPAAGFVEVGQLGWWRPAG